MKRGELAVDGVFFAIGVFSIIHSISLPDMGAVALSPGIFPMILGALLVLFSVVRGIDLISSAVRRTAEGGPMEHAAEAGAAGVAEHTADEAAGEPARPARQKSVPLIVLMFAAYAALLPYIHFIPASIAFSVAAMLYVKRKFTLSVALVSVIAVAVIYLLFMYVFHVRLP